MGCGMNMEDELILWVLGTVETTPIPFEISNIYFVIGTKNGVNILTFCGSELDQSLPVNFEYYPHDGQYFENLSFQRIKPLRNAKLSLKFMIEEALLNEDFKRGFSGKIIHLVVLGEPSFFDFKYIL